MGQVLNCTVISDNIHSDIFSPRRCSEPNRPVETMTESDQQRALIDPLGENSSCVVLGCVQAFSVQAWNMQDVVISLSCFIISDFCLSQL